MNNLLKNPLFWVGAVIGVRWLYKNKPDSKLTQVFEELEEGATNLAYQTAEYAGDVIDTGADTLSDSFEALGWNMEDGDDMPGDDVGAEGVDTVGGSTGDVTPDPSATPDDDVDGGVPFTGRRNPLPTHSNFNHLDFSSSQAGDVELTGLDTLSQPILSEWNDDAEGSGNTNTGLSGVGAFTPESAVDTASERVQFRNDGSAMSFNDFDY